MSVVSVNRNPLFGDKSDSKSKTQEGYYDETIYSNRINSSYGVDSNRMFRRQGSYGNNSGTGSRGSRHRGSLC